MAEQTSTLQVKGKLGNVVGYKGRGKQLARIRVSSIKNPNTVPQAIQRMITATNARAYSRLGVICDHSFEGVAYKQASQDYFLKENAKLLRQFVADNYPTHTYDSPGEYIGLSGKSDPYEAGVGLLISKGSLPSIQARYGEDGMLDGFGSAAVTGTSTVAQVLAALGAVAGDQITLVFVPDAAGGAKAIYTRYVLNTEITAEQAAAVFTSSSFAAICDARSIIGELALVIDATNGCVTISYNGTMISDASAAHGYGAAIILSRKASDGSYLRSTQWLRCLGSIENAETPYEAVAEWVAGTTEIDTQSEWYLNQSRAANASF